MPGRSATDTTSVRRPQRKPCLRRIVAYVAPAAAVVLLMWLADKVFLPAHGRGVAQTPLGVLVGLGRLLEVPGNFLMSGIVGRLPYSRALVARPWVLFACLSFGFYAAAFAFVLGLNSALNRWAERGNRNRDRSSDPPLKPAPT